MNSDTIRFYCPSCGIQLDVPASLAGVTGPCPSCQHSITAPIPAPAPQEKEPLQEFVPSPAPPVQAPVPQQQSPPVPPQQSVPVPQQQPVPIPQPQSAPVQQQPTQQAPAQPAFPSSPPPITPPQEPAAYHSPEVRSTPTNPAFLPPENSPVSTHAPDSVPEQAAPRQQTAQEAQEGFQAEQQVPQTRNKSRIPSLLFLAAILFIAGAVTVGLISVMGIFDLKIPFLPGSKTIPPVEVGAPPASAQQASGNQPVVPSAQTPSVEAQHNDPTLIDPDSPSESPTPQSITPPPSTPPAPQDSLPKELPPGKDFREGETPLPSGLDLSFIKLKNFLLAQNLLQREGSISKIEIEKNELSKSVLAGPIPKPVQVTYFKTFKDEGENRTDFFYLVGWDGNDGTPSKPVTVQLHQWSEREEPQVHTSAFLEFYEEKLARYAASPRDDYARFHVLGRCIPKCFEIVPKASEKATLKLASFPKDTSPVKAYFSKNSELLDEFKENLNGLAMNQEIPLTVTLAWSDKKTTPRHLELVKIDSFDWHP